MILRVTLKMLKIRPNKILEIAVILIPGIAVGLLLSPIMFGRYLVKNEITIQIDPTNIISILINVLLVVYVTRILTPKNEEERVEKDLLIKRLEKFENRLDLNISKMFAEDKLELVFVTRELKSLRQDFNSTVNLLKVNEFVDTEDLVCLGIDSLIRDIKDLFTDTPRDGEGVSTDIKIDQGKIIIGSHRRSSIEKTNSDLKAKIFDLVVMINRK